MALFAVRAVLVVLLVLCVVFAWRAWKSYPASAVLAAAVATFLGIVLLKSPVLAALALAAAFALITYLSRPRSK